MIQYCRYLFAGLSSLVMPGVPWHTQILAGQLTLFQPGGSDYAHLITTSTPKFSDLPTSLYLRVINKINNSCFYYFIQVVFVAPRPRQNSHKRSSQHRRRSSQKLKNQNSVKLKQQNSVKLKHQNSVKILSIESFSNGTVTRQKSMDNNTDTQKGGKKTLRQKTTI